MIQTPLCPDHALPGATFMIAPGERDAWLSMVGAGTGMFKTKISRNGAPPKSAKMVCMSWETDGG